MSIGFELRKIVKQRMKCDWKHKHFAQNREASECFGFSLSSLVLSDVKNNFHGKFSLTRLESFSMNVKQILTRWVPENVVNLLVASNSVGSPLIDELKKLFQVAVACTQSYIFLINWNGFTLELSISFTALKRWRYKKITWKFIGLENQRKILLVVSE